MTNDRLKKFTIFLFAAYIVLGVINFFVFDMSLEGVGDRWIVYFGDGGFFGQLNPMTLIMSFAVMLLLILVARSIHFERIPGRLQAAVETFFDYFWEMVEDSVPNPKYRRQTFVIAMSFFLYISVSNVLGGMPGINVVPVENGLNVQLFTDTWYTPTSDLNVNLTYALMVLVVSHFFAARSKGVLKWLKSFFEPNPLLFPINIISEIAKPISHSLRLFGNVMGGGILVLIISYMLKYFVLPVFLWGFFGWFIGLIQAFVFSLLTIAYIGSLLE
ncbi:ATP synthase F0, A subunit [Petrotoga mobilis SJ95]|uniref:ATP synthase subunit a n=1 Tax=Petrotoga mobilis (strain DSM 10674 / SJ95) TaxID=403833 RepID=A9BFX9_PETMO|nr:F0F1 ATP synthase subunit A [Petrotoga mobilis]ABX31475.1 ATP synthase F0, A subunit [Petrotoga mobilis SJ95]